MHSIGYIHRDLKPANILTGIGKKENIIYLIDYGLTKKNNESHWNMGGGAIGKRKMAGTPIYAAINAHLASAGNLYT